MKIGNREIGPGEPPYIVAEIGANHGGDLQRALRLIEAAKAAGADAVKFQAYTAETITLDSERPEFKIKDGPWQGWRLYDLYKLAQTPFAWFPQLAEHAEKVGVTWFASAFDPSAVDMLAELGAPAIKIASFELVDLPLISYAALTGLPIILSTGMATDAEIYAAANCVKNPIVLHCVSGYPTPVWDSNLHRLRTWIDIWPATLHGLSDHTIGSDVPVAATVLGACMIEKHFTLSRDRHTPDAEFSLMPGEFRKMARAVSDIWCATRRRVAPIESEEVHRPLRRSLFAVQDIKAGELFTADNVRSIRPGDGLPPSAISHVLGYPANHDIARGTPLSWNVVGRTSVAVAKPVEGDGQSAPVELGAALGCPALGVDGE